MPIFKKKDEKFFRKWSSQMAYILGKEREKFLKNL